VPPRCISGHQIPYPEEESGGGPSLLHEDVFSKFTPVPDPIGPIIYQYKSINKYKPVVWALPELTDLECKYIKSKYYKSRHQVHRRISKVVESVAVHSVVDIMEVVKNDYGDCLEEIHDAGLLEYAVMVCQRELGSHNATASHSGACPRNHDPHTHKATKGGEGTFRVMLTGLKRIPMVLNVRGTDTIAAIRARIQDIEGLPTCSFRLYIGGKPRHDDHTMDACNLRDQSEIKFVQGKGLLGGGKRKRENATDDDTGVINKPPTEKEESDDTDIGGEQKISESGDDESEEDEEGGDVDDESEEDEEEIRIEEEDTIYMEKWQEEAHHAFNHSTQRPNAHEKKLLEQACDPKGGNSHHCRAFLVCFGQRHLDARREESFVQPKAEEKRQAKQILDFVIEHRQLIGLLRDLLGTNPNRLSGMGGKGLWRAVLLLATPEQLDTWGVAPGGDAAWLRGFMHRCIDGDIELRILFCESLRGLCLFAGL